MIARRWRGATRTQDAAAYADYVRATGLNSYRRTPGNVGAFIFQRPLGDLTEIVTLSLWESRAAVEAFAGPEIDRAIFYPDDDRFLVERDLTVIHFDVEACMLKS